MNSPQDPLIASFLEALMAEQPKPSKWEQIVAFVMPLYRLLAAVALVLDIFGGAAFFIYHFIKWAF